MPRINVSAQRTISAPPASIHALISDYRNGRQRILTENYINYRVEKGGKGAGTVITYRFKAARRERGYRLEVSEPTRGRVLAEKDRTSSFVSTWTVEPRRDGKESTVTIAAEWEGSGGIGGFFERAFAPRGLRKIYNSVLENLSNEVAKAQP